MVRYLHLVVESQCTLPRAHKGVKSRGSNDPAPPETAEMGIFRKVQGKQQTIVCTILKLIQSNISCEHRS